MTPNQLNTKQLIALWYGGLLAVLVLSGFAFLGGNWLPGVLATLVLTALVVILLGDHPNAETGRVYKWTFALTAGLLLLAGLGLGVGLYLNQPGQEPRSAAPISSDSEASISRAVQEASTPIMEVTISPSEVSYPAQLSGVTLSQDVGVIGGEKCEALTGNVSNEGDGVIKGIRLRVFVQDTLGNHLADPTSDYAPVTLAPGETQSVEAHPDIACMSGPNRQYFVTLTHVQLRE